MERMMIKKDFHGYKLSDALQEVEVLVGEVRKEHKSEVVELIIGHGIIQTKIIELLKDYNLDVHQQIGNSGIIVATIE